MKRFSLNPEALRTPAGAASAAAGASTTVFGASIGTFTGASGAPGKKILRMPLTTT